MERNEKLARLGTQAEQDEREALERAKLAEDDKTAAHWARGRKRPKIAIDADGKDKYVK